MFSGGLRSVQWYISVNSIDDVDALIELRHLRYFLAVARHEHVTRAAEELHITQSTLSHQLQQLEESLGVTLFDRIGRGLQLTQEGSLFVSFASRALLEVEEGKAALGELRGLTRGRLRIGVIHTYNETLLPPVVADFVSRYPGVHVSIEDLPAAEVERAVAEGDLDLGIAFSPPSRDDVTAEELFSERLVLVVRPDDPLAGMEEVSAERLRGIDVALQTTRFSSRARIDQALGEWIRASVRLEMSSIGAMLQTIRLRGMAAIIFEGAMKKDTGLVQVPIVEPRVDRVAALIWHARRTQTSAARMMAQAIRSHCQRHHRPS